MSEKIVTPHTFRVIVDTTTKKVLSANPKRRHLLIFNKSSQDIYVCSKPTDTKSEGYVVPGGKEYKNPHNQGAIYLVGDQADIDVRIEEDSA